jgi:hypothetical protein
MVFRLPLDKQSRYFNIAPRAAMVRERQPENANRTNNVILQKA